MLGKTEMTELDFCSVDEEEPRFKMSFNRVFAI
jgi:hypothetical protein